MHLLVCGGRHYRDQARLYQILDRFHQQQPITLLIHGAAPGADQLAGQWAQQRGIRQAAFAADWPRYGRAAGPMRNGQMLKEGQPDLIIAFPGGRGTDNMLWQGQQAGVATVVLNEDDSVTGNNGRRWQAG